MSSSSEKGELIAYLKSAKQTLKSLSPNEQQSFLRTIVEEIRNKELTCATGQRASEILEMVIADIRDEDIFGNLFDKFFSVDEFSVLAQNQYSSHVLETLLEVVGRVYPALLVGGGSSGAGEGGKDCGGGQQEQEGAGASSLVVRKLQALVEEFGGSTGRGEGCSLVSLCSDVCGTHVFRAILSLLGGFVPTKKKGKKDPLLPQQRIALGKSSFDYANWVSGGGDDEATSAAETNHPTTEDRGAATTLPFALEYPAIGRLLTKLIRSALLSDKVEFSTSSPQIGPCVSLAIAVLNASLPDRVLPAEQSTKETALSKEQRIVLNGLRSCAADLTARILGNSKDGRDLFSCPVGSTVLEAVVQHGQHKAFFTKYLFGSWEKNAKLEDLIKEVSTTTRGSPPSESTKPSCQFLPFVLQKAIAALNGSRDAEILTILMKRLDVEYLLGKNRPTPLQMLVVKLVEACARLDACHKGVCGVLNAAMGKALAEEQEGVPQCLRALLAVRCGGTIRLQRSWHGGLSIEGVEIGVVGVALFRALLHLPARFAGPLLLGSSGAKELAGGVRIPICDVAENADKKAAEKSGGTDKGPAEKGGKKKSAKSPTTSWLVALAHDGRTTRLVQDLFSSPGVSPQQQTELCRALIEASSCQSSSSPPLVTLACNPKTGWVVTSLWKACQRNPGLKEQMADLLLQYEKALRENNIAVWKACQLHSFKLQRSGWTERQWKQSKKAEIFEDIVSSVGRAGPPSAKGNSATLCAKKKTANVGTGATSADALDVIFAGASVGGETAGAGGGKRKGGSAGGEAGETTEGGGKKRRKKMEGSSSDASLAKVFSFIQAGKR